jgi:hypothetical protein
MLLVQVHDHLAVRVGLERRRLLERFAESHMVVDLAVDSEDDRLVLVDERLGAGV